MSPQSAYPEKARPKAGPLPTVSNVTDSSFPIIRRISTCCTFREVLEGMEFSSEILLGRKIAYKHFFFNHIDLTQFYL